MPRRNTYADSDIKNLIMGYGIPTGGTVYYLDTVNGLDTNDGKAPNTAFKTLIYAENQLTANKNDVLVQLAGATAASTSTTGVTWDKNYTHYIGMGSDIVCGKRASITAADASVVASMFTVSASGCIFRNLQFFYGVASAAAKYAVTVTGQRNEFTNCQISGIGHDTQDVAGACSLFMNGGDECTFRNCYIGLNTIGRGTAVNSEILFDGSAVRNYFEDCVLTAWTDTDTHTFVTLADNEAIQRELVFKNCLFLNESNNVSVPMASAFTVPANPTGFFIVLQNCMGVHITAWETGARGRIFALNSPTPAAITVGLARQLTS